MWTSSMIQLDLSRRRVAAISFLSNISVEEDQKSEEENLHCLKNTRVLSDFRARQCAQKPLSAVQKKDSAVSRSTCQPPELSKLDILASL